MRLIRDRIAVEPEDMETMSEGGIILADSEVDHYIFGTVRFAGPKPGVAKVGDRVIFSQYVGAPQLVGDTEYLFMNQKDVEAVVDSKS